MGFWRNWGRLVAYPVLRPAKEIKQSAAEIRKGVQAARDARQSKVEEAEVVRDFLGTRSPAEKFEEMYAGLNWTESELQQQRLATARTRLGMVGTGILGFFVLMVLMWVLPRWLVFILGPVAVIVLAGCVAQGLRYAWWELNIELRSLTNFRSFMSRADIFSRLFAGTPRPDPQAVLEEIGKAETRTRLDAMYQAALRFLPQQEHPEVQKRAQARNAYLIQQEEPA